MDVIDRNIWIPYGETLVRLNWLEVLDPDKPYYQAGVCFKDGNFTILVVKILLNPVRFVPIFCALHGIPLNGEISDEEKHARLLLKVKTLADEIQKQERT